MPKVEKISWRVTLKAIVKFELASMAPSAITFGFVGLNRYFERVWNDVPGAPYIFTVQGQVFWGILTLIAVVTGAFILGALALTFPWAVMKGTDLVDLWKVLRERTRAKSRNPSPNP